MITLDSTLKSLEVVLEGAVTTNQLTWTVAYVDIDTTTFGVTAASEGDGATNDTTPVTAVAAPASGKSRQVKHLTVYNKDTVDARVFVQINNNGTTRILCAPTLGPGETLEYNG